MLTQELGQNAVYEEMAREKEQNAALTQTALLEWHLLSKQKDYHQSDLSSTSGISVSTTQTQTSCAMEEDYQQQAIPPSVQSTSLDEEESRMQLKPLMKEEHTVNKKQSSSASRSRSKRGKRENSYRGGGGVLSAGESNSSFASQSSEPSNNRLPASLASQV